METLTQSYNWKKVIGTLVGIIGFISAVLGIYVFYFQNKGPNIVIEVISSTNVLDINANLSKLDITYNNESLKTSKQNLRIFTIRVKNYGNESVLKDYYDINDPLGLTIGGSKIVENPEIITTSNSYLKKNLRMKINNDVVLFNDLILDRDQSFTIKLLVLHPSNRTPVVSSIGKIAGQNSITVTTAVNGKDKSYWLEAFNGSFISQAIRAICYGVIFILFIALFIFIIITASENYEKRKRKNLVSSFKTSNNHKFNDMDEAIFRRFITEGAINLSRYVTLLTSEELLNKRYKEAYGKTTLKRDPKYGGFLTPTINIETNTKRRNRLMIDTMLNDGMIINIGEKVAINDAMFKSLVLFMDYLKSNGYDENRTQGTLETISEVHSS